MKQITQWLKEHNITTHVFGASLVTFLGAYVGDEGLRDAVNQGIIAVLSGHPKIFGAVVAALGLYLKYSGSHSTQGQAAQLIETALTSPQKVETAVAAANATTPASSPVVTVTDPPAEKAGK